MITMFHIRKILSTINYAAMVERIFFSGSCNMQDNVDYKSSNSLDVIYHCLVTQSRNKVNGKKRYIVKKY